MLAIQDIVNRNLKKFIIKVLFASLFHYSAIVMLPLYFLNLRKISIIYFFLPVIGLFLAYFGLSKILLLNFTDFLPEFLSYKLRIYLSLLELGEHKEINIFNFFYSSLLILLYFIFSLYYYAKNKIKFNNYDILKVACDEFSVPTSTTTIVEVSLKAISKGLTGLYHLTNSGYASRYEWAKEFFKLKGINKFIYPAYQSDFNLPAKRPRWSAMSNEKISKELDIEIREWREELERVCLDLT